MKAHRSPALRSLRAAQVMFFVNAAVWLVFAVLSVTRMAGRGALQPVALVVVAVLMVGNAGAMALAGVGLGTRGRRLAYWGGLAILAVNVILTFTDQVGLLDWLTLALDLALIGLLIATRANYAGTGPQTGKGQGATEARR